MIQLQVISEISEIASIESEWARLLASCGQASVSMTPAWFRAWWASFGERADLSIMCFRVAGDLVAVAPLQVTSQRIHGVQVRALKSLTNGHTPSWDFLVNPSLPVELKKEILSAVVASTKAHLVVFDRVPEGSELYGLAEALSGKLKVGTKPCFSVPIIDTRGDWEKFFLNKSRKFRQNMRKKLRQFEGMMDAQIEMILPTRGSDPVCQEVIETSGRSWKAAEGKDLKSNSGYRKFFESIVDELGPDGGVRIWTLRVGPQVIAFEFHLVFGRVTYPLRADFDESFRSLSPGSIVDFHAVKSSFEDPDIDRYDSCADEYWYLGNWTDMLRRQSTIELFRKGIKSSGLFTLDYIIKPRLKTLGRFVRNENRDN